MPNRDNRDARAVQAATGVPYTAALRLARDWNRVPAEGRVPWLMSPMEASGHIPDPGAPGGVRLVWACGTPPPPVRRRIAWGRTVVEEPTRGHGHTTNYHQVHLHEAPFPGRRWPLSRFLAEAITLGEHDLECVHPSEVASVAADLAMCRELLRHRVSVSGPDGAAFTPVTAAEREALRRVVSEASDYWIANDYARSSEPGSLDEWLGITAEHGAALLYSCWPPRRASVRFELADTLTRSQG